jgi:hypothetical protein
LGRFRPKAKIGNFCRPNTTSRPSQHHKNPKQSNNLPIFLPKMSQGQKPVIFRLVARFRTLLPLQPAGVRD